MLRKKNILGFRQYPISPKNLFPPKYRFSPKLNNGNLKWPESFLILAEIGVILLKKSFLELKIFIRIMATTKYNLFKGVVHSETTSGVLNNVEKIGKLVKSYLPGI